MASIVISGDTSGSITLSAPAVSGSSVLTLPAVTDTVAGIAATQTLTNKTLTSPSLTTPTMTGQATIPTINLTGGQITFPATQVTSADANTLDDYEEGTWTPNQGNALTVVGAFSSSGTYTKIGRQVTVLFAIAGATTIAVTAGAQITGNLPFTAAASMDTAGTIYRFGATGGECIAGGSQVNAFSGAAISAGGGLNISITYFV